MDNKEKLELARDWYNEQSTTKKEKVLLEKLFPEIIESEDERIRKELIKLMVQMSNTIVENYTTIEISTFVAWLVKQGELQTYVGNADTMRKNLIKDAIELVKQGEQKFADKVEPKFKIGDWAAIKEETGLYTPLHIVDMDDKQYRVEQIDGSSGTPNIDYLDRLYHLWTIDDAKDGDVLVIESGRRNNECLFIFKDIADREVLEYCYYRTIDNTFSPSGSFIGYLDNVYHPATKEQRDLLFQEMKKAGYEWDADEKALVMIGIDNDEEDERYEELMEDDETNIKQNPVWSEEDETGYNDSLWAIKQARTIAKNENDMGNLWYAERWLKSIKDRVQLLM